MSLIPYGDSKMVPTMSGFTFFVWWKPPNTTFWTSSSVFIRELPLCNLFCLTFTDCSYLLFGWNLQFYHAWSSRMFFMLIEYITLNLIIMPCTNVDINVRRTGTSHGLHMHKAAFMVDQSLPAVLFSIRLWMASC